MTIIEKVTYTDEEIKAHRLALLEALETQKYLQGQFRLGRRVKGDNEWRYCCIGVACVVAGIEPVENMEIIADKTEEGLSFLGNEHYGPDCLNNYYGETPALGGMDQDIFNPEVLFQGISVKVSLLNDGVEFGPPWTHPQIAKLLRHKWGL